MEFRKQFSWEDREYLYRTNPMDYVEVIGHTEHNGSKTHKLLRKIECQVDGQWKTYPTVIWVDGKRVHGVEGLFVAFFAADGNGGINVLLSPDGVPDGELMSNAEREREFTQKLMTSK